MSDYGIIQRLKGNVVDEDDQPFDRKVLGQFLDDKSVYDISNFVLKKKYKLNGVAYPIPGAIKLSKSLFEKIQKKYEYHEHQNSLMKKEIFFYITSKFKGINEDFDKLCSGMSNHCNYKKNVRTGKSYLYVWYSPYLQDNYTKRFNKVHLRQDIGSSEMFTSGTEDGKELLSKDIHFVIEIEGSPKNNR